MPRVADLKTQYAPLIVPIDTFAPAKVEILKPFHVVVQPYEDEFVATFFDANISATGDTQQEAVANVKDMILMQFKHLEHKSEDELGAARKHQRRVLCAMLKRHK